MSAYKRISVEDKGNVMIIGFPHKRIREPDYIEAMRIELKSFIDAHRGHNILFSLQGVDIMYREALLVLIACAKSIRQANGQCLTTAVSPVLELTIKLVKLETLLGVTDNETNAIARFRPAA